jgi:hypothetical protein
MLGDPNSAQSLGARYVCTGTGTGTGTGRIVFDITSEEKHLMTK